MHDEFAVTTPDYVKLAEARDRIYNLEQEVKRLKEGRFTDEELQDLCHNMSEKNAAAFKQGCTAYQKKLLGTTVAEDVREQAAKIAASSPDVYCVGIGIAEQIRAMEV
jgi:hypothetical protein